MILDQANAHQYNPLGTQEAEDAVKDEVKLVQ